MPTVKCTTCEKEVITRNPNKYCSVGCHKQHQQDVWITSWKNGTLPMEETYMRGMHNTISNRIRNYLFQKYDNKCCECGWNRVNPKTGLIPLQVEHIDGNSKNNVEANLLLLCPNCHSLTPTFGALNRGSGRSGRTEFRKQMRK